MKKILLIGASALLVVSLLSCSKEELNTEVNQPQSNETRESSFSETVKEFAVKEFAGFPSNGELRSGSNINVEGVDPIVVINESSRSGENVRVDTVAYIVRFNNSSGSMMLVGDRHVPLKTVAMLDNKTISIQDTANNAGLALFTKMCVNYYYELLGQKIVDRGILTAKEMANIPRNQYLQYVTEFEDDGYVSPWNPDLTETTPWQITAREILLPVEWDQGYPYNLHAPPCGSSNAPAGCVAIAVSQITSYHKHPSSLSGQVLDWNILTKNAYQQPSANWDHLAWYIRKIGDKLRNKWSCSETGSTINRAQSTFSQLGYATSNIRKYKRSDIDYSLSQKLPVYIRGCQSEYNIFFFFPTQTGGHAWVIDGVLEREQTITLYDWDGNVYKKYPVNDSYYHNNWGSGDSHNGFFKKDVFDCNAGPTFRDNRGGQELSVTTPGNFQFAVKTIINIKPN